MTALSRGVVRGVNALPGGRRRRRRRRRRKERLRTPL